MEDILALVLIFGGGTVIALGFSPIGRAIGERIRGRAQPAGDATQLSSVLDELEHVRRELAELQERMDFAERLLAKNRDTERVAPPQR